MSREAIRSNSPSESNTETEAASQTLRDLIAVRAYEIFQSRGAVHGSDLEDWLQAEKEVLKQRSQPTR